MYGGSKNTNGIMKQKNLISRTQMIEVFAIPYRFIFSSLKRGLSKDLNIASTIRSPIFKLTPQIDKSAYKNWVRFPFKWGAKRGTTLEICKVLMKIQTPGPKFRTARALTTYLSLLLKKYGNMQQLPLLLSLKLIEVQLLVLLKYKMNLYWDQFHIPIDK